jgi:hypothetical protein
VTDHERLLTERILPWALADDDVRGLVELGSRAAGSPADEWADMDLLILARDPDRYHGSEWLDEIAPHWVALTHPGPIPDLQVRQVLFEDALDFDIIPMRAGTLATRVTEPGVAFALGGGFRGGLRPLVDKDGEMAALELPGHPPSGGPPSETAFDFVAKDFLFQVIWASKHLRRGELWAAKDDVDGYMKADLVQMLEWQARIRDPDVKTRSGGRYLEEWADPAVVARLGPTFAVYDPNSVAIALLNMIDLFGEVGSEVADHHRFTYPSTSHAQIRGWAKGCLEPLLPSTPHSEG